MDFKAEKIRVLCENLDMLKTELIGYHMNPINPQFLKNSKKMTGFLEKTSIFGLRRN